MRIAFKHPSHGDCPMKGKRLPEVASGALLPFFEELCRYQLGELMIDHQRRLSADVWQNLVATWETGKIYLWAGLQVKLDFFQRLPWLIGGIAHHDRNVARRVAKQCVDLYDGQEVHVQELHHHCTRDIFGARQESSTSCIYQWQ